MKKAWWRFCLILALAGLPIFGKPMAAFAAEEDRSGSAERLERLERRLNELAQRQEQLMQRLGPMLEQRQGMAPPGGENMRQPNPPPGFPAAGPGKQREELAGFFRLLVLIGILCNILLAIWIFTDIRRRGEGSCIFVAIALVAGIPAAIIYALVRIGDRRPLPAVP